MIYKTQTISFTYEGTELNSQSFPFNLYQFLNDSISQKTLFSALKKTHRLSIKVSKDFFLKNNTRSDQNKVVSILKTLFDQHSISIKSIQVDTKTIFINSQKKHHIFFTTTLTVPLLVYFGALIWGNHQLTLLNADTSLLNNWRSQHVSHYNSLKNKHHISQKENQHLTQTISTLLDHPITLQSFEITSNKTHFSCTIYEGALPDFFSHLNTIVKESGLQIDALTTYRSNEIVTLEVVLL